MAGRAVQVKHLRRTTIVVSNYSCCIRLNY